jgi:hypothetical protein
MSRPISRSSAAWRYARGVRRRAVALGEKANRTTLDAFTRWAYEQGVTRRLVDAAELFPASVRSIYRI